jgi:HK97 family phage major capsid protein
VAVRRGDIFPADHWVVLTGSVGDYEQVNLDHATGEAVNDMYTQRSRLDELVRRHGTNPSDWDDAIRDRAADYQARERELAEQVRAGVERQDYLRAAADNPAAGETYDPGQSYRAPRQAATPGQEMRDRARRALDGLGRSVPADSRERLTRSFDRAETLPDGEYELDLLSRWLVATSSPAYARAVSKLFRDPENGHREFDSEELSAYRDSKVVQRAMSEGTGPAGGFLLPLHLDPQILLSNTGVIDPIRKLARVDLIATTPWHGVSSAGVTASWDAEGTEVSDDSPTLAQPTVPVWKGAGFIAASIEAAMDTRIGDQVTKLFLDAKLRLEGSAFLTGTGTGQPTGVVTSLAAGQKVATATADVLVRDDVTKPAVALPPRWQPNAAYLANNATAIAIGSFETTAGALRYPTINESPASLLRKPFYEHSGMNKAGDTAAAGNDNVLILGDWSNYLVVDVIGATVEFIPHLFGATNRLPTGQRGWYMYWRTGGAALIPDAFRLLTA